ncbi:AAC(3) family N-acetyltransferase [Rivularia sp. UHCC 0363]|uniref:AAC(3) family N-acetyltransferase n=1 Tax=Rivularia sp. UHCC 0363 TaxID=3110244 RepID=UPI002B202A22|nr:AAC(3) family N-acetyltransferase [Rivularia sp. UHCC 0363]MEA5598797.1 AAC(3) family N-acetyltransferase [Rivularia sp. UHCC 0363]
MKLKDFLKSSYCKVIDQKSKLYKKYILPIKSKQYQEYNSEAFKEGIKNLNIHPGDSVFIMLSLDKNYLKTGKKIPVNTILKDILDYLGSDSTIMVLGFSINRKKIISKENIFHVSKTPTECGILAEILRRKKESVRSIHPIFSAITYGKKAAEYCASHHESPYPFDEKSPYYKIMKDGGKYLGIGVGFEAFTPCHMIDDYYNKDFKHQMYFDKPERFSIINKLGEINEYNYFIRNPATHPGDYDPHYYFQLLNIEYKNIILSSGIKLFSFKILDFFNAAVNLYDQKMITIWDTGSFTFFISRSLKFLMLTLIKKMIR